MMPQKTTKKTKTTATTNFIHIVFISVLTIFLLKIYVSIVGRQRGGRAGRSICPLRGRHRADKETDHVNGHISFSKNFPVANF